MKLLTFFLLAFSLFGQTARFPTSVATTQQLGVVANGVAGTLNNSLTTLSTSLGITDGTCTLAGQSTACASAFQVNMFITVQNEIMQVCSLSDSGTVTTLNFGVLGSSCPSLSGRGLDGTQIAAHPINSPNIITVYNNITAWTHNADSAEIIAIEQSFSSVLPCPVIAGGVDNTSILNSCFTANGNVSITTAGTYTINTGPSYPNNSGLFLGPGVVIQRKANSLTANDDCFGHNSNYSSGSNSNITIWGPGTLDCQASTQSISSTNNGYYPGAGFHFIGVTKVRIGGGITIQPATFAWQAANGSDFVADNFTINYPGVSTNGDGPHFNGPYSDIHISNMHCGTYGPVDDNIALNGADEPIAAITEGDIHDVFIRNVECTTGNTEGNAIRALAGGATGGGSYNIYNVYIDGVVTSAPYKGILAGAENFNSIAGNIYNWTIKNWTQSAANQAAFSFNASNCDKINIETTSIIAVASGGSGPTPLFANLGNCSKVSIKDSTGINNSGHTLDFVDFSAGTSISLNLDKDNINIGENGVVGTNPINSVINATGATELQQVSLTNSSIANANSLYYEVLAQFDNLVLQNLNWTGNGTAYAIIMNPGSGNGGLGGITAKLDSINMLNVTGNSTYTGTLTNSPTIVTSNITSTSSGAGPTAYWLFADGSGTTAADNTGNGHTGTLAGSPLPTWVNSTPKNLLFSGTLGGSGNWVTIPATTGLLPSSVMSVCAWVYPTASVANAGIIASRNGTANYQLTLANATGGMQPIFQIWQSNGTAESAGNYGQVIPLNSWSHICGVADGTNLEMFVNGQINPSTYVSIYNGTIRTDSGAIIIGNITTSGTNTFFDGNIRDVRFYTRGLLPSEVLNIYNNGN